LRGQRHWIGGIAVKYLDRHRAAIGRTQQTVYDLQLALLAVARVAEARQLTAATFEPGRGDVVEHQRPGREVAVGERRLDHALARTEPVERASTSSTAPSRNSRPRLEPAVATASSRAMASLEAGAIRRLATWKSGLLLARLSLHSGRTY